MGEGEERGRAMTNSETFVHPKPLGDGRVGIINVETEANHMSIK